MSQLTELLKKKNWRIWLKALASALISGGATGLSAALTAPYPYSLKNVLAATFVAGVAGAALYIKQSPMPAWEESRAPLVGG